MNGKHIPASKPSAPPPTGQVQALCGRLVDVAQALAAGEDPTGLESGACYRVREAPKNAPLGETDDAQPLVDPATVAKCAKCQSGRQYLRLDIGDKPAMLACFRCGWGIFVSSDIAERQAPVKVDMPGALADMM